MESIQTNTTKEQVKYEQIENTPFTLVEKNNEFYLLLGDTAVRKEPFKSRYQAKRAVKNKTWEILANTICIITNKILEYEKNNKSNSANTPNN